MPGCRVSNHLSRTGTALIEVAHGAACGQTVPATAVTYTRANTQRTGCTAVSIGLFSFSWATAAQPLRGCATCPARCHTDTPPSWWSCPGVSDVRALRDSVIKPGLRVDGTRSPCFLANDGLWHLHPLIGLLGRPCHLLQRGKIETDGGPDSDVRPSAHRHRLPSRKKRQVQAHQIDARRARLGKINRYHRFPGRMEETSVSSPSEPPAFRGLHKALLLHRLFCFSATRVIASPATLLGLSLEQMAAAANAHSSHDETFDTR